MDSFTFPSVNEQLRDYFSEGGRAMMMLPLMGKMFATDAAPAKDDYSKAVDLSFLQ